jgi:CRISPR/Cas system-associated exonuclease Cas4 (RecB family)
MHDDSMAVTFPHYLRELADVSDELSNPDIRAVPDVVQMIHDLLRAQNGVQDVNRATGYYHPSSIASKFFCPLDTIQARMKAPAIHRHDTSTILNFETGHAMHDMIQKMLSKIFSGNGCKFSWEVPVVCEPLFIRGSCDGLIEQEDSQRVVVEIKTKNSTAGMREALPEHVMQAHIYQFVLRAPLGMVLYYDKAGTSLVAFAHAFRWTVWQEVERRVLLMEKHFQAGTLPEPRPHRFCNECSYRHACPKFSEMEAVRLKPSVYRDTEQEVEDGG